MAAPSPVKKPTPETIWELPDGLWDILDSILQERYPAKVTGRPRVDLRAVLDGIIFRMRTGCQWNHLPECFGSDSTVHRWFQRFCQDKVFEELWAVLAEACDDLGGVDWQWQSADGRLGKARFGGDKVGKNPTDRGKLGTKISLIVEGHGEPLGAIIDGANIPDCKLLEATIEAIVVERPEVTAESPQNLCLDKGYDNPTGREAAPSGGHTPHIRRIGEEKKECDAAAGHKPRRWVVERTFSWLSKCRAILVRYDFHASNYLGLIQLACATYWYRKLSHLLKEPVLG